MTILFIMLSAIFVAGVALAFSLLRSGRLAAMSGTSLSLGLAFPRLALAVAFLLCGYATFVLWASRSIEVFGSPMYLAFSPAVVTLCAVLFCVWVLARSVVAWRANTLLWRYALGVLTVWAIVLLVAQLELPARLT